ncbi:hypothetical protein G9U51_09010 [Calidifontibacter sp. DB0510]|uniref:AMIN-like domain-containing protein n=1 Tax=Metallococcus carri TaxID=1656884 RepID=A0A967B0N3_9MICO|nr:hypothetical protein [Metallococcus carri]NOP38400.1 hypothetical protein [Calidifontibacter sp. DB2511S]
MATPVAIAGTADRAQAATSTCAVQWGSLEKRGGTYTTAEFNRVRTGQHACYDRIVIDVSGPKAPGYIVKYVDQVREDGSGKVVPVRGGAKLQIVAMTPTMKPVANKTELADVTGYRTFRQVAYAGSFEGQTTIGLGVRARLPFKVWTVNSSTGSKLVVDVAHTWS